MKQIPHCESCNAPIIWARTAATGSWIPIDRAPDPETGNVALDWPDDHRRPPRARAFPSPDVARTVDGPRAVLRTAHFATCHHAAAHRTRTASQQPVPAAAAPPAPAPYEQEALL